MEHPCPECGIEMVERAVSTNSEEQNQRLMKQFNTSAGRQYQEDHNESPADFADYDTRLICPNCDYGPEAIED